MRPQKNPLEYGPYQTIELAHWKKYLESKTDELQSIFRKIIAGIKDKSLLVDKTADVYEVEFYHGVDELDFWLRITDKEGKPVEHEFGNEHFFKIYSDYAVFPPLKYEFVYPTDLDIYYEDERWLRLVTDKHNEFFYWFVKNWIACEGHQIGVYTYTLENSIVRIYNLNKLQWEHSVNSDPEEFTYPLTRELTDYELRKRIGFQDRFNIPTKWRYFEKANEFIEIGIFSYQYYFRKGAIENFNTIPFDKLELNPVKLANKIDSILNDGFFEKPRPNELPLVMESIKDWKYWSTLQTPIIPNSQVFDLVIYLDRQLPIAYKKFISTNYLQSHEKQKPDFPIAINEWRKIEKYYLPTEIIAQLKSAANQSQGKIPIAKTTTDEILMMDCQDSSIYIFVNSESHLIQDSLSEFIDSCIKISNYFCPVRLHVDKRNVTTLKDWFEKGGKLAELKTLGNRSILQDALGQTELMELLLNNGADPNKVALYADRITRPTLDLMIEKGLDFQAKLDGQQWLRKNLNERSEFADLLEKYPEGN